MTGSSRIELLGRAQHAEAVAFGQPQIGQHDAGTRGVQRRDRLRLIARLDDGVALRLERVAQHRAQRVFVFDEQDRGIDGAASADASPQPAGRNAARRASSWKSAMAFLSSSIALLSGASSSSSAFWRFCSMTARCAGSSRFTKSVVSALMWVCSASGVVLVAGELVLQRLEPAGPVPPGPWPAPCRRRSRFWEHCSYRRRPPLASFVRRLGGRRGGRVRRVGRDGVQVLVGVDLGRRRDGLAALLFLPGDIGERLRPRGRSREAGHDDAKEGRNSGMRARGGFGRHVRKYPFGLSARALFYLRLSLSARSCKQS